MSILRKLSALFRKQRLDGELDAELASHVQLAIDENLGLGMTPAEARRQALVRLGGIEQSKEEHRDARGLPVVETMLQDLRYAVRSLRRDSGFALFAILIIGLGIGASTTVFSVVNTVLVKPLPFQEPHRLVWIANKTKNEDSMSGRTVQVSPMVALRERNRSFEDIAAFFAFYSPGEIRLSGGGEPERLTAAPVSERFFPLLGVKPMLGRQFTPDECKWNGPRVALLSHGFWQRRFGSDPKIVGQTLRLNDQPVTVTGVMPASLDFGGVFAPGVQIDLFTPFPLTPETDRWGNTLALVGRLKPDVTLPKAQAEADVLGVQITAENTRRNGLDPVLTFLGEYVSGRVRPALFILAGAVGVVMLIVCANLANLMLARTAARQKEMAIRTALGAGRQRLIRQLLTESLLLTGCGALLGMVLAFGAAKSIAQLTAFNLPLLSSVAVDARVLGFTVLLALATGLTLGLAPVWQISALRLNASLSQRGSSGGQESTWVRGALVVSEVAFAAVLLVGAGLLTRSLLLVMEVDLGFRPVGSAALRLDAPAQYNTNPTKLAWLEDALQRVRSIGGVEAAGMTDALPLGKNRTWFAGEKGKTYTPENAPLAFVRLVTDGYLRSMGMTLKQGRDFNDQDIFGRAPVILINETLARRLFGGENPIGKVMSGACAKEREVVGVVADVHHTALEKEAGNEMYIPMKQCGDSLARGELVLRSTMPVAQLGLAVEASLRPISPDLPKGSIRPLTQLVDRAVTPLRFMVLLLGGFAGFALLLASLGIYGLISYSVSRRTQEIGIRMALGESAFGVQKRIVLRTLALAGSGIIVGALAARMAVSSLGALLYGIPPGDPAVFAAVTLLLVAIAALAGYVPARRASQIDPMLCLRAD